MKKYFSFTLLMLSIFPMPFCFAQNTASLFDAELKGVNQFGKPATLEKFAGKWQVVAFIYTDCTSLCPIIIADLKNLDTHLNRQQKHNSIIHLITLNPEKDTPAQLAHFSTEHVPNDQRWQFLQFNEDQLQTAAMLFNIRYKKMETEIAHSRTISLLDPQGHLVYQSQGNEGIGKFLALIP